MNSRRCGWVLGLAGALVSGLALGQALERVANTTLSLPERPPSTGYDLELAFPEVRSFSQPVAIVSAPGETHRLFVLERSGRIRVIPDLEAPTRETFLSLTSRVESQSGEQGLLGLAFHPDYQRNGTFFVFYTARGTGDPNRVSRFQVDPANPNRALADSEVILFSQRDDAGNHNAGDLHFGPDGYLYVALGDEGAANDSLRNSQRLDRDFFAGIMRIDVDGRPGNLAPNPHPAIELNADGEANYWVPWDNPYVGVSAFNGNTLTPQSVRTEFWAVGLRNPWRMAFDPVTGELYTGDVGQGRREEVNLIRGGENYGWNFREGFIGGPNRRAPEGVTFADPILDYPHGNGANQGRSITGGIVYRGTRLSALFGAYLFADYASGNIWALRHDGREATHWETLGRETGISAFGVDPRNGDVLIADFNSSRIWRLVAETDPEAAPLPQTLADTGAFADLASLAPAAGVLPYAVNAPFWSDGAIKRRWFSVPDPEQRIGFAAQGPWSFPNGSVWVKHFDLELTVGDPSTRRRLETRFIVKHEDGVYGLTYRWNEAQDNAMLVPEEGMDETFTIQDQGVMREQVWRYPSRSECLSCHSDVSGGVLGFDTAQLNRDTDLAGRMENQVLALSAAGYFETEVEMESVVDRVVPAGEASASLEERVNSYLATNCSQCHQPGGPAIGLWDARLPVGLEEGGIVDGALANPAVHPGRRIVVPGDPRASELWRRMTSQGLDRMPPVGSNRVDSEGLELVREWIAEGLEAETFAAWQERYFGSAMDPRAAPLEDFDQDGFGNRTEYRLGTNPLDRSDYWRLAIHRAADGISLRFPRIAADRGVSFELQARDLLDEGDAWEAVDLESPAAFVGSAGTEGAIEVSMEGNESKYFRVLIQESEE